MQLAFELARLALVGIGAFQLGCWLGNGFIYLTRRRTKLDPIIED